MLVPRIALVLGLALSGQTIAADVQEKSAGVPLPIQGLLAQISEGAIREAQLRFTLGQVQEQLAAATKTATDERVTQLTHNLEQANGLLERAKSDLASEGQQLAAARSALQACSLK